MSRPVSFQNAGQPMRDKPPPCKRATQSVLERGGGVKYMHKTLRSNKIGIITIARIGVSIRALAIVPPRVQVPLTPSINLVTLNKRLGGNLANGKVPCLQPRRANPGLP